MVAVIIAGFTLVAAANLASASDCQVPSPSHPTVQSALDDVGCSVVLVSAGRYPEELVIGRSLELIGDSVDSVEISGSAFVVGADTQVHLEELRIELDAVDGSLPPVRALVATGGAEVTTDHVVVVRRSWPEGFIFFDGFETGTTGRWSHQSP